MLELSGVTTDIFSLYYSPIQILTGLLAGLILPRYLDKDKKRLKLLLLALIEETIVPGTDKIKASNKSFKRFLSLSRYLGKINPANKPVRIWIGE